MAWCAVACLAIPTAGRTATGALDVEEYRVEGNSVLAPAEIERAVYPFLGPNRGPEDVERARAALEALYNKKGYPTVSAEIPRQSVTDGVVVLKVTERKVGRLRVTGSRYYDLDAIKHDAPSLTEGRVPNINDVQRDITGLNRLADRSVTPVLRAGRAPDTVDVDLQVADALPLHGSLELNNRYSVDTTKLRLSGSLSYDNLWQRGDSASLYFQVAPQRPPDATVGSASYLYHIPGSKLSLLASYFKSDSNVTTVGATNVIGKGEIAGLRLLIPLGFAPGFVQTLSVGMDYKHFDQDLTLSGAVNRVPITYWPITLAYQADWSGEHQQTGVNGSFVLGPRGLGSNREVFDQNRAYAQPNFAYLRSIVEHTHDLPGDLQAYGRLTTQASADVLIPNEQFAIGGLDTVRGYYESEALGDYGAALQLELRSPPLQEYVGAPLIDGLRLHAFTDLGGVRIHKPLPEQQRSYGLGSVGTGVRVRLFDQVNGALEDAVTLSDGPNTKAGTNRVLFRLYGNF